MFKKIENIFSVPELRRRILFTLALLIVYRIGTHVPTPGINSDALQQFFAQQSGNILGMVDMFTGGALSRLTVFGLGIMPYISASIIIQLLTVVVPHLAELKKQGSEGQEKITKYTRYGTVGISAVQGLGIAIGLEAMNSPTGTAVVMFPGWGFRLVTALTLTTGTVFLMWLGERITEKGIGNGISLIIFAGIVARFPAAVANTFRMMQTGELQIITLIVVLAIILGVTAAIVYVEISSRRLPIQYVRKAGAGTRGGNVSNSYLPLKLNPANVIPIIFAASIMSFPSTLSTFSQNSIFSQIGVWFSPSSPVYYILYVVLIVFFTYFYTSIIFNPDDVADNIQKSGGVIPGKRPGKATSDFIDYVLSRLTFIGALYLSVLAILPQFIISWFNVPFYFGGTSLLIVIGVGLDLIQRIESHLITHNYDGFLKRGKVKRGGFA
ncbi:preprotein translocase, SecY subunit [Flexistipes sinusarabici DSM 4947]|uniref:Protein translocase subunit SecY n=2 Tax=Flexistipes sinusarabici TaxID=2352 RepID=F8E9B8_FLESM|nr:preprotein translocase subunit SecY [Flexistipes sinusarabici]AEI14170.1 preprotein translocase, SecY subunit [Flexistipes sinusarabici DSM 4947]